MAQLKLLITLPFERPLPGANWVVFSHRDRYFSEEEAPLVLKAACRYARKYQVYVCPGPFESNRFLGGCLISPQGEILGGQQALHLRAGYRGRFQRGEELHIFETPYGKVFLAIDADLLHPEVIRAATLAQAQLIIGGLYLEGGDYSPMQGVCGAYSMAQQNQVFVLDANNMVTTLAAPSAAGCPGDYLLRDGDQLPHLLTLDLDQATGFNPHRHLDESFYLKYAAQLGR